MSSPKFWSVQYEHNSFMFWQKGSKCVSYNLQGLPIFSSTVMFTLAHWWSCIHMIHHFIINVRFSLGCLLQCFVDIPFTSANNFWWVVFKRLPWWKVLYMVFAQHSEAWYLISNLEPKLITERWWLTSKRLITFLPNRNPALIMIIFLTLTPQVSVPYFTAILSGSHQNCINWTPSSCLISKCRQFIFYHCLLISF